jgi:hypothetical protein
MIRKLVGFCFIGFAVFSFGSAFWWLATGEAVWWKPITEGDGRDLGLVVFHVLGFFFSVLLGGALLDD